ncbi:aquaporin family protein [bacterium]|nr:MAG: aquaporin family protein [bacterium]
MDKYKALFIEFLTTFLFTLGILLALPNGAFVVAFVALGLFATMVYVFGEYSGAHFNPAISFGALVKGEITWKRFLGYVASQVLGASLAAWLVYAISKVTTYSAVVAYAYTQYPLSSVSDATHWWIPAFFEFLFTALLVFSVMALAYNKRKESNQFTGLTLGVLIFASILLMSNISGGSLNPAIAFGTNLVHASSDFSKYFANDANLNLLSVYLLPQLLGGLVAGVMAKVFVDNKRMVLRVGKASNVQKTETVNA